MQVVEDDHNDRDLGRQALDTDNKPGADSQGIGSGGWRPSPWVRPTIVAPEVGDELADDAPRQVGLRLLPAGPDDHTAPQRLGELADEAGLADPPISFDHDQAMLSSQRSLQLGVKLSQLGVTPHERGLVPVARRLTARRFAARRSAEGRRAGIRARLRADGGRFPHDRQCYRRWDAEPRATPAVPSELAQRYRR